MRLIILTILFMLGNWLWDVGNNSHIFSLVLGTPGYLSNGFWNYSAIDLFHLSWYISMGTFFVLLFYARSLEKKLEKKEAMN